MRKHSPVAWGIASNYSSTLCSETHLRASRIDLALDDERRACMEIVGQRNSSLDTCRMIAQRIWGNRTIHDPDPAPNKPDTALPDDWFVEDAEISVFPHQPCGPDGLPSEAMDPGITLRDWFAGQALTGLLAHDPLSATDLTARSYLQADLMLAQRKLKP